MYYKFVCLITSIILISQFGWAHTPVTLSLSDVLYDDVASCASNLQVAQDYELIEEDFFNVIVEPDYRAIRRALEIGANPNALVAKEIRKLNGLANLRFNIDRETLEEFIKTFIGAGRKAVVVDATALHLAVIVGDPYVVELLLEKEARIDIKNISGHIPFTLLAYQTRIHPMQRDSMVKLFIKHNPSPTELDIAYTFEQAVIVQNFSVIEAIARYASESEVITRLKNDGGGFFHNVNYILDNMGIVLPLDRFRTRRNYRAAIRHLKERNLL